MVRLSQLQDYKGEPKADKIVQLASPETGLPVESIAVCAGSGKALCDSDRL
jgi:hypothetical protein